MTQPEGGRVDNGPLVFLEMAGRGCISGHVSEWPQLVPSCKWAVEEIAKLQARVKEWEVLCAWGGNPEAVHDFIKGQQNRIHAAQEVEKERDALKKRLEEVAQILTEEIITAGAALQDASRLAEALHPFSNAYNAPSPYDAVTLADLQRAHEAVSLHQKVGEGKT